MLYLKGFGGSPGASFEGVWRAVFGRRIVEFEEVVTITNALKDYQQLIVMVLVVVLVVLVGVLAVGISHYFYRSPGPFSSLQTGHYQPGS